MADNVNNPSHYNSGGIECIDAIEASLTREEFIGFCKGNALKYVWRELHKEKSLQDIEKAVWYLKRSANAIVERDAHPFLRGAKDEKPADVCVSYPSEKKQ